MNYKALHDYFRDISQNLGDSPLDVKFFHGRKSMLNLTNPDRPLYVFSLPFESSGSFTDSAQVDEEWTCSLIFYMQDRPDSAIDQNDQDSMQDEIKTLTVTEEAANKFLRLCNENDINDDLETASNKLIINNFTKQNTM